VVFSEVEEGSEGNGHQGEVTGGDLSVIGTSTDIDDVRGDTGDTLGKTETGTQNKTEDATSHGPNGVLIRCEGVAPT